jgi:hypothetical protein
MDTLAVMLITMFSTLIVHYIYLGALRGIRNKRSVSFNTNLSDPAVLQMRLFNLPRVHAYTGSLNNIKQGTYVPYGEIVKLMNELKQEDEK